MKTSSNFRQRPLSSLFCESEVLAQPQHNWAFCSGPPQAEIMVSVSLSPVLEAPGRSHWEAHSGLWKNHFLIVTTEVSFPCWLLLSDLRLCSLVLSRWSLPSPKPLVENLFFFIVNSLGALNLSPGRARFLWRARLIRPGPPRTVSLS